VLSGTFADGTPFNFARLTVPDLNLQYQLDEIPTGSLVLHRMDPPAPGPFFITASIDSIPPGIRHAQTLVADAGAVVPALLQAGRGSTINIEGGTVGRYLEAVGATINMSAGLIDDYFHAYDGTIINVSGGTIDYTSLLHHDCVMNVSGGSVLKTRILDGSVLNVSGGYATFLAFDGATINVTGGAIGNSEAFQGSTVNIGGGRSDNFNARAGSVVKLTGGQQTGGFHAWQDSEVNISGGTLSFFSFTAEENSKVNIVGSHFMLDGVDLAAQLSPGVPLRITSRDVPLAGLLADGTPFNLPLTAINRRANYFSPNAALSVTLVPEPSMMLAQLLPLIAAIRALRLCR
jgi:hypothetical protein